MTKKILLVLLLCFCAASCTYASCGGRYRGDCGYGYYRGGDYRGDYGYPCGYYREGYYQGRYCRGYWK